MSELFLDWDGISFKEFRKIANNPRGKRSRGWMKNRLGHLWAARLLHWAAKISVSYRKSAGGRVHVQLVFDNIPCRSDSVGKLFYSGGPTTNAEKFVLRVYLDDDHARVDMDITRWSKGETINRLFDTKYKNGKIGHAGPWIPWFTLKGVPSRTSR